VSPVIEDGQQALRIRSKTKNPKRFTTIYIK